MAKEKKPITLSEAEEAIITEYKDAAIKMFEGGQDIKRYHKASLMLAIAVDVIFKLHDEQ